MFVQPQFRRNHRPPTSNVINTSSLSNVGLDTKRNSWHNHNHSNKSHQSKKTIKPTKQDNTIHLTPKSSFESLDNKQKTSIGTTVASINKIDTNKLKLKLEVDHYENNKSKHRTIKKLYKSKSLGSLEMLCLLWLKSDNFDRKQEQYKIKPIETNNQICKRKLSLARGSTKKFRNNSQELTQDNTTVEFRRSRFKKSLSWSFSLISKSRALKEKFELISKFCLSFVLYQIETWRLLIEGATMMKLDNIRRVRCICESKNPRAIPKSIDIDNRFDLMRNSKRSSFDLIETDLNSKLNSFVTHHQLSPKRNITLTNSEPFKSYECFDCNTNSDKNSFAYKNDNKLYTKSNQSIFYNNINNNLNLNLNTDLNSHSKAIQNHELILANLNYGFPKSSNLPSAQQNLQTFQDPLENSNQPIKVKPYKSEETWQPNIQTSHRGNVSIALAAANSSPSILNRNHSALINLHSQYYSNESSSFEVSTEEQLKSLPSIDSDRKVVTDESGRLFCSSRTVKLRPASVIGDYMHINNDRSSPLRQIKNFNHLSDFNTKRQPLNLSQHYQQTLMNDTVTVGSDTELYRPKIHLNNRMFVADASRLHHIHINRNNNTQSSYSNELQLDESTRTVSTSPSSSVHLKTSNITRTSSNIKSSSKISLAGAKKRLGFKQKGLNTLSIHRSEEVLPNELNINNRLAHNAVVSSISNNERCSNWINSRKYQISLQNDCLFLQDPRVSFVDGLGEGQVTSRQALVSPHLGDIELSLSDQRGMLEVEVIRARQLQMKPATDKIPAPYVKLYLMQDKKCIAKFKATQTKRTLDPFFNQKFIFRDNYSKCVLQAIVWGDYSKKDRKSLMGIVQIHLDDLDISDLVIGWYKLLNVPSMASCAMSSSKSLRRTIS